MLHQIIPALTAQQIAHLHQPQHIVGIGKAHGQDA